MCWLRRILLQQDSGPYLFILAQEGERQIFFPSADGELWERRLRTTSEKKRTNLCRDRNI